MQQRSVHPRSTPPGMPAHRRRPIPHRLALACSAAMLLSTPAMAQDAPASQEETSQDATTLDTAVQRQIDLLLKAGPIASASAKTLVRNVIAHEDGDRFDADNAALIARLRVSPEGQEGLAAFLDKRTPSWIDS